MRWDHRPPPPPHPPPGYESTTSFLPATTITGYATDLRKMSANRHFPVGTQFPKWHLTKFITNNSTFFCFVFSSSSLLISTETVRTVTDGKPRTSIPTLSQILSSGHRLCKALLLEPYAMLPPAQIKTKIARIEVEHLLSLVCCYCFTRGAPDAYVPASTLCWAHSLCIQTFCKL